MGDPQLAQNPGGPGQKFESTRIRVNENIAKTCRLEISKTYFEFDSAKLAGTDPDMAKLADCFSKGELKGRNVRITGYADARGSEEYNKQLGKSRAHSVAEYLETRGVHPDKVIEKSAGEALAVGKDSDGMAFDRRVDISLAD